MMLRLQRRQEGKVTVRSKPSSPLPPNATSPEASPSPVLEIRGARELYDALAHQSGTFPLPYVHRIHPRAVPLVAHS